MQIDINSEAMKKAVLKWAQTHPAPDDPVVVIPDSRVEGIAPRTIANEIQKETQLGKVWVKGLLETYAEAMLPNMFSHPG